MNAAVISTRALHTLDTNNTRTKHTNRTTATRGHAIISKADLTKLPTVLLGDSIVTIKEDVVGCYIKCPCHARKKSCKGVQDRRGRKDSTRDATRLDILLSFRDC